MTNAEKYKTSAERHLAYALYCDSMRSCDLAILHDQFDWLELEYETVLRLCPFCNGEATVVNAIDYGVVMCKSCEVKVYGGTTEKAIAAWNRRTK